MPWRPLRRLRATGWRARIAALAVLGALVTLGVAAWARGPSPVPDAAPRPLTEVQADAARQAAAAGSPARASSVPNVPRAWRTIARSASDHAQRVRDVPAGEEVEILTLPASRMRDTIGLNVDLWRTEYGYADFGKVVARIRELQLRHARVGMQSGGTYGLTRMQQLGRAGVRLNVVMGDAYGRFGTSPYDTLARRLRGSVLPYVDAVEGTNEADLTRRADWAAVATRHQRQIVATVRSRRGTPIGVIAPSTGRIASYGALGDLTSLSDAGNAHAYASAGEPGAALDRWLGAAGLQRPGGPFIVTEAGFQTDLRQRKYHTPTSPQAAASYIPRTILEAMVRGVPQVYLYEFVDRWNDPLGIDTAAHFGLLRHDLTPKPAWPALVRLQRLLLDGGRPDRAVAPLRGRLIDGPSDLRVLGFRHTDGSASLAIWRAARIWDEDAGEAIRVPDRRVQIGLTAARADGAHVTDVVSGQRRRLPRGARLDLQVGGTPLVVTGLRPTTTP